MTDSNEILNEIEGLCGPEGSRGLALALFDVLKSHGYLTFDAANGLTLTIPDFNDDGATWNRLIAEAEGA